MPLSVEQAISYLNAIIVALGAWFIIDRQILARRAGWYTPTLGLACQTAAYSLLVVGLTGGLCLLLLEP